MKDKWINAGYDGEDLKPHIEPVEDYSDPARIGKSARTLSPQLRTNMVSGFHSRGNQGLSAQSEVQRGHSHLLTAGPQRRRESHRSTLYSFMPGGVFKVFWLIEMEQGPPTIYTVYIQLHIKLGLQ